MLLNIDLHIEEKDEFETQSPDNWYPARIFDP